MNLSQTIIIISTSYLIFVAFLYAYQRHLIFFPSSLGPETPADHGIHYQDVYFHAQDGTKLHGWWIPQQDQTPLATLLYCHGNGATLSMLSHVAAIFHSYGLNTFMFDYRAYGASEGIKSDLSEEAIMQDARAALDWVRSKNPGAPIVVWGHSLGSAVASRLTHEQKVSGVILEGAFSSVPEMARHRYPYVPIIEKFLHSPFKTINYVQSRHNAPLLMIHTEHDSVIPLALGKRTFDAAPDPKEWILVTGADHNEFPDVHEAYKEKIVEWIKKIINSAS